MSVTRGRRRLLVAAWLLASVLCLAILLGLNGQLFAHDEEDKPHKGNPPPHAQDTMRAFQEDQHAAQELASMSLTTCDGGAAGEYPCNNIDLVAFLPLADIGGGNGNDVWGWTDSLTGKEYALMGRYSGTSFVGISDPANPVYLGNLPPHASNSSWRDIKVYADHAFIVSEAIQSGMQVFDLSQLRNVTSPPVTFAETAWYSGFLTAHNLVINEESGYAYAVGSNTCSGGLHMVDIGNPANPVSAGCFSTDGYTHDAQCVTYHGPDTAYQGHEICFNSNENTLTIVDVTNKSAPVQVSRTGYTGSEYTHQGWLTEDHAYLLIDDELDESRNGINTRTYVWDVSDLDNPINTGSYTASTTAIDHNQYIKGGYAYQANYRAGLRILDISDIANANLSEVAYFDIYPSSDSPNFNGAWSNYPFFDSGIVAVSGIEQGLFILRPNLAGAAFCGNGVKEGAEECDGSDFGGATCGGFSCSGGSLSCSATCLIDLSTCSDCPVCDFDGVCETGEDCNGCGQDCISGMTPGSVCGNNICETSDGEDCLTCPSDCNGLQKGNPKNRFCCSPGFGGVNPVTCGDSRCSADGNSCTDQAAVPLDFCCGDLVCEGDENTNSCSLDCGSGSGCDLAQVGEPCVEDTDCCSNKCRGRTGAKTCK